MDSTEQSSQNPRSESTQATGLGDHDIEFASKNSWVFYWSIIKRYWKRFTGMVALTAGYTAITNGRLLACGILVAALQIKWEDPAVTEERGGMAQLGVKALLGIEQGWNLITGENRDFIAELRDGGDEFFFGFLGGMVVVFAIAAVFSAVAAFFKDYLAHSIIYRGTADVRKALFNHLTRQSVAYFNRQRSGDVISRLTNDVSTIQLAFRFFFQNVAQEPIKILVFLGFAFFLDPFLFFLTVPLYVLIMIPLARAGKKVIKHGRGRQEKLGVVTEAIQQLFSGIRIVRAFGMERREQSRFSQQNDELIGSALQMVRAKAKGKAVQELLYNLGVAAFLFGGVGFLMSGMLEIATLVMFIGALVETYNPIKALSRAWNQLQESRAGVERVTEVLREQPLIIDDESLPDFPGIETDIVFEDVCFSYDRLGDAIRGRSIGGAAVESEPAPPDLPGVIRNVSLKVNIGEVVAVVGPSGAGKSTLVDLLARFYDPQQGRILVDGVDIRNYRQTSYVRSIAIVSQDPFLFNTSIADNIRYGKDDATIEEVREAARVAFAHEFIEEQPDGYDTVIGDRGVKLSGGQRQRVTIARAVLKNAPILILDEATSSLDTQSEREVQRAMENLMRDRTTFVIAHRLSTIVHSDRIVVLEEGRIVESGRHEELLSRRGRYSRLWRSQNPDAQAG